MDRYRFSLRPAAAALLLALLLAVSACHFRGSGTPDALFLDWDQTGSVQLFRLDIDDRQSAVQLTGIGAASPGEVTTYSLAPDSAHIAYSLMLDEGGSEMRLITVSTGKDALLVACPQAECAEPSWSPDSRRLVYERREFTDRTTGSSRLWWLDSVSGETIPLVGAEDGPAYGAVFSPDGQWLAYVSAKNEGIVVVNLLDGFQRLIASATGMPPRWSLDSQSLIYSMREVVTLQGGDEDDHNGQDHENESAVRLYLAELTDNAAAPKRLSPDTMVDDSAPSLSPDGQWLTVGRRVSDTVGARQLWIMRTDGSEARALSDELTQNYGPAMWSPDGRYLLYQRFPQFETDAKPSIWMMDVETGEERRIADTGFIPQWLPQSN